MQRVELIVEKSEKKLWGRVTYNENLIADEADSFEELETKFRILLKDFENLESISFDVRFDVNALFDHFDFINVSKFAKYAGINAGLMRQYASGVKHPRKEQAEKIESALHRFSKEAAKTSILAA